MKGTFRILLAFYGVVIILTASCRKSSFEMSKSITAPNNTYNYTSLNQLFGSIHPYAQTIQVNAGTYTTVHATGGTKLTFYPNSFKDNAGNIIRNGVVSVQITEMYTSGLMIANRSIQTSNGKLLQNSGQVYIKATLQGQEVFANKYGIGFKSPTASSKPYSIFYGSADKVDSLVTWTLAGTGAGIAVDGTVLDSFDIVSVDSNGTKLDTMVIRTNYNQFDSCTSFNWISCSSFFASGGAVTNLVVTPSDTTFNPGNTAIFLVFPGYNSITALTNYYYVPHAFSLMAGYEVPVNVKADLVAVAYVGGTYYYYQQTGLTITEGLSVTPTLTPTTLTQIEAQLSAL